jgi:hypothetical protein
MVKVPCSARLLVPVVCVGVAALCLVAAAQAHAFTLDGWGYTFYRFEDDEQEADQDLSTYLDLRMRDLLSESEDVRLELVFSGWGNWNFSEDGFENTDSYVRVSRAYARIMGAESGAWARLGRFWVDEVDSLHLDGGMLGLERGDDLEVLLFGGRPVSYYSSTEGDAAGGAALIWSPWWQTTLQASGYAWHEEDETFLASGASLNQYLDFINGRVWGRLRLIDAEVRDLYANVVSYVEPAETTLNLHYYLQPNDRGGDEDALTRDFSHLGRIFGTTYAYHRFGATAQAFVGEHWLLLAGVTAKRLLDDPQRQYEWANVDSTVVFGGVSWIDGLVDGLALTVLANWVDNNGQDYFYDITGEVEYAFTEELSAAAGLTYSGYHFAWPAYPDTLNDQDAAYSLEDHIGSKVYYLDLDWRPAENHRIKLSAAYEDMDGFEDACVLRVGYQIHFDWTPGEDGKEDDGEGGK